MSLSSRSLLSWEPTASMVSLPPSAPSVSTTTPTAASTAPFFSAGQPYAQPESYLSLYEGRTASTLTTLNTSTTSPQEPPPLCGTLPYSDASAPTAGFPYRWMAGRRGSVRTPPRGATPSLRLLTRQTNAPMLMSADASLCDGPGRRLDQASSSPGVEEKRAASTTSVEHLLERGTGTLPLLTSSTGTAAAAAGVHADSLAAASAPGASRYSCCLRRSGVSFLQLVQARCKAATAVPQSSHTSRATSPSTSQPSASGCWCGGSGGGGAGGANTPTGPWKSFTVPAGPPAESATRHDGQREPHRTETFPLGGGGNASGPVAPGGEGGVTGGRHSGSRATAGRYGLYSSTGPATTRASASLRSSSATSSNDTSSRTRRFAGHAEEHAAVTPPALMHAERLAAERPTVSRRTSTAAAAAVEPSQRGGERMEGGFLTPPSLLRRTSSPVRSAAQEPAATAAAATAPLEEPGRSESESLEVAQPGRVEGEGEGEDTPRVDVSARPKTALPLGSSSHHSAAGAVFVSTSTARGERALQFQDPVAAHTASSPTSRETHMRGGASASLTQRERTRPPSLSDPRSPQQQQLQQRAASAVEGRQGGASPLPTLAVAGSEGSRSTHSSRSPAPTVELLSVGPCTSATASASSPLLSHPVAAARASCPCASLTASTRDAARHASAHASPSHVPVSPSAVSSPSLASPLVFHAMPTPPAAVSASSASAATGTLTDASSRSGSTGQPGLPFPPRDASGAMGGGGGEGPSSGSTDGGAMESDGGDRHASPPPPISFSVLAASNSATSTAATPTADGGTPTTATTAAAAVFPLFGTTLQPCYQRTMHSRASSPVSTTPTAWLSATAHLPPPPPSSAALHFGPPAPGDCVGPPPPPSWQAPNTAAAAARSAHSTFVSHPMPIPTAATSGLGLHSAAVPAGGVAGAGGGPPSRHSSLHSSPHQGRHGSPQSRAKAARSRHHPAVEAAPANAAQSRLVPTDSAGRIGRMTDTGVLMVVPAGIAASWSAAVASSIVVAPNRFSWTTTVPPDAAFAMVEYRTPQADTKGGSTKDTIDTHDHMEACEGAGGGASAAAASPLHGLGERVVTYFPVHTEVLKKQSGYFSALFGDCGSPFVHSAPDEYVDLATLPQVPANSPQTRWRGGEKRDDGLGSHVEEEVKAGEKTTKEKADAPRRASTHACCGSAAADDASSSVSPSTSPSAATATGAAEAAPTTTRVPVYYIYWPGCDGDELTPPPPPSVLEASCSAPGASARAAEAMDRDAPSLAVCCVAQLIHYLYTGALPIFHNCDDVKSASSGVLETADVCVFARQFAVLFAMSAYTSLSSLTQAMLNTLWRLLTVTHAVLPFWSVAGHMRLPDMRTLCEQWVEQHLCVFLHASTGRGLWRGLPLDQLQLLVAQRAAAIQAAVAAAAAAGGAAEGEEGEERGAEAAAAELAANAPVAVEEEGSSPARVREESASRSLEARPSLTTTGAAPRSYGWPTTGVALPQALMGSGDISSPLGRPRLSRHSSQADGIPSSTRASIPSGSSSSGGGGGSSHVTVVVQGTGTDGLQGGATAAAARATSPLRAARDSPPTPVTHPVAAMAPAGGRAGRRGSDAMAAALLSAPGTSARYLAFESPARSPAGAMAATPHPSNTHLHESRLTHSLTSRGDHHSSSDTVVGGGGSNNSSRNELANQSGISVEASREGEASSPRADGADETTNSVAATAPDAAPPLIPHSAMPAATRTPPLARPLASLWPLSEDRSSASSHARSPMLNSNVANPHAVAITTSAVATRHSWHDSGAVRSSGSASAGTQSNRPLTFADVEPPGAVADTAAVRDEQRPALSNAAPMRSPTNSAGLQFAAIAAVDAVPISRASSSLSNAAAPVTAAVVADANASTRPAPSPALSSSSSPAATSRSSSSVALQVSFANTGSSTSVTGARFAVDDSRSAAWPRSRNAPHTTPSSRHPAQPGVRRASTGAAPALTPFPSTGWMVVPPSLQLQADGAWRIGGYGRLYTVETREMLEERQSAWLRAEHEQRRDDRDVDDMYLSDAQLLVRLWTWWVARCEDVERAGGAPTEGEKVEVAAMLRRALTAETRESVERQLRSAVTTVEVGDEESLSVGVLTPSMWRDVQRFLEDNPESVEMYALPL